MKSQIKHLGTVSVVMLSDDKLISVAGSVRHWREDTVRVLLKK